MHTPRHAHRPHHGPAALLHERIVHETETSPSMLQRWMRRWSGAERGNRRSLSDQRRLLAIRRLVITDLEHHSAAFSQRDLRLYLCLIGAPSLAIVQRLRFDLFDLLCRQIGEGAATVRLHEIDAWLSPRT
jgi:hypothetical protein